MFGQQPNQFSGKAPSGFTFGTTSASGGTTPASSGFTFGSSASGTTSTSQAPMASKPFSFGSTTTSAPASTFNFAGFAGGTAVSTSSSTPASSITRGTTAQKPAAGLSFGLASSATTASTLPTVGGFNFTGSTGLSSVKPTASTAQGSLFSANTASSTPTTSSTLGSLTGGTSFLSSTTTGATGLPQGQGTSTGQGFKLGPAATTTGSGFGGIGTTTGFGSGLTKPATCTTLTSTQATTGLSLAGTLATPSTASSTSAPSSLSSFGASATSTAVTSALSTVKATLPTGGTASSSTPQQSYKQLEEQINKWVSDLEDYERTFLDQAAQVNAWDRLLMENGEKITELNNNVESVKAEQKRLDEELDFILAQQQELEVLLKPLEEELQKRTTGPLQLQHADRERELTYGLAKDVDGQLKKMVGDLKSIIDHLNEAGSTQQENNDPIIQVAKILNAHMNSLQWIDQNAALLQRKVDEVSSLNEVRRKEQERNFRLAFD